MMSLLPSNSVVLQLIPSLQSGGAERTVVDMVAAIVAAGGFALVASSGGRLVAEVEKVGGKHVTLPLASKNPFVMWLNYFRLKKLMVSAGVSLVHARSRAPAWSGFYAARACGLPFVTTYHGLYKAKSDAKRLYNRIMVRGVLTIANSDYTKTHILAEHGSDIDVRVVNRGVDCAVFSPRDFTRPTRDVVVLPARLTQGKGHFDALAALSLLSPRPLLVFVGEGSLKPALELEVLRLGLVDDVEFRGHVSDMPSVLAEASLVIAPSTVVESFGRVPIEAGAMGKVCVVSRLGAMQYTVLDGVTGYLCEAGNAAMLASLIEKALSHSYLVEMGQTARAHIVAHYGLKVMCDKTIAIYHEILSENQK